MCFSAEASFGLSAVLLPAGGYCVWNAFHKNRRMLSLAVIPIAFGLQQFSEGWVWLGLHLNDMHLVRSASYFFLYFALSFWPFWIPLSAFLANPDSRRKPLLAAFTLLGLVGGLMLFLPLLSSPEVLATQIRHHSIYYEFDRSAAFAWMPKLWWRVSYIVVVGVPMLIAPARGFMLLGIALIIAAVVSQTFYWYAFTSVWCFSAAILSLYLCYAFRQLPAKT